MGRTQEDLVWLNFFIMLWSKNQYIFVIDHFCQVFLGLFYLKDIIYFVGLVAVHEKENWAYIRISYIIIRFYLY